MNNNSNPTLKALDFAIIETGLYLNTHPNDAKALAYFNKLTKERKDSLDVYHKNCGPLTIFDGDAKSSWDWVKTPWPWEMED
ncbi:MAG: spore coat protein CotJB [Clostridia bacterium]|nr:spore coat protein CotJB [Clostridia bacterium]